ncbi:MAG: trypsin-like peptidase domain-containing protein [Deltaproteobacteria bacterium]|nr:trypsin-like peptidase domain-containing protein [Deltaproteobacteria bacterium]
MRHFRARTALLALALLSIPPGAEARQGPEASGATPPPAADSGAWSKTLATVVPSVVSIKIRFVRAFDTEHSVTSQATGFLVDAKEGLILTNRHVVGPGPSVAEAVFADHEEVELTPVYRDPVHDFGVYRFDPKQVRYQQLDALELRPDHATVGREIRVVGNDSGEKLSILAGTIARTDRSAPAYGRGGFNDFNTFYIQAASSTSGGSSGSPVLDVHGHVVALNAGGRMLAASSYYLPLDRVVRALDAIRAGRAISRGTLQLTTVYEPYHEVRRLGTTEATEQAFRKAAPEGHGMLVIRRISPGGPAAEALKVGDVLLSVGGRRAVDFLAVETVLDEAVGQEVEVVVERAGERVRAMLKVDDLHAITPAEYLEVGGGILNALSYQVARQFDLPTRGVYVARPGYMFDSGGVAHRSVLTAIDGKPVTTLDEAAAILASLGDGARVPVRSFLPHDRHRSISGVMTVDRRFFPFRRCKRDDATGRWPCQEITEVPPTPPVEPATVALPKVKPARLQAAADSLVEVRYRVPFRVDGVNGDDFAGTGLILDATRGLVVVDRDTVAVPLGDCTVTFGGSLRVPAEVVFLHPLHDVAVVRYDPKLIGKTPVRPAVLRDRPPEAGEKLRLLALTRSLQVVTQEVEVTKVDAPGITRGSPPRFREGNVLVASVNDSEKNIGGALVDGAGQVAALWFSVLDGRNGRMLALPTYLIKDLLPALRQGKAPTVRTLGADLALTPLASARDQGLSAKWIAEFQKAGLRRLLSVARLARGVPASEVLEEGDLLLRVGGRLAADYRTVEQAERGEELRLTVLREGKELELQAKTVPLSGRGTEKIVLWAGALLQEPHWPLTADWGQPREGVYISWVSAGSPAQRYPLQPTRRIVAVQGESVADLEGFLAAVKDLPERAVVRLDTVDLQGRPDVVTLLLDLANWPTSRLDWKPEGWVRTP